MSPRKSFDYLNRITGLAPLSAPAFEGADPVLVTPFRAAEAGAASLGLSAAIAAEIWRLRGGEAQSIAIDLHAAAASLLSFSFIRKNGQAVPRPAADAPTVGLYRCGDGRWIHLHGGFPSTWPRTLDLLNAQNTRDAVAAVRMKWNAFALEDALAFMNLAARWRARAKNGRRARKAARSRTRRPSCSRRSAKRRRSGSAMRACRSTACTSSISRACSRAPPAAARSPLTAPTSSTSAPSGLRRRSSSISTRGRASARRFSISSIRRMPSGCASLCAAPHVFVDLLSPRRAGEARLHAGGARPYRARHHLCLGLLLRPQGTLGRTPRLGAARADRDRHRARAGPVHRAAPRTRARRGAGADPRRGVRLRHRLSRRGGGRGRAAQAYPRRRKLARAGVAVGDGDVAGLARQDRCGAGAAELGGRGTRPLSAFVRNRSGAARHLGPVVRMSKTQPRWRPPPPAPAATAAQWPDTREEMHAA